MRRTKITCVYALVHLPGGRVYVGSAVDFLKRKGEHLGMLNYKKHHCVHLQNAWNKYGAKQFRFRIVERCGSDELLAREQFYIETAGPNGRFNICLKARSHLGVKRRPETKVKLSQSLKGRKLSESHCLAMSKARKGINLPPVSPETKDKMSAAAKRVANTPEGRKERSERAKRMHAEGRIPPRPLVFRARCCAGCKSEFIPARLPSGMPSGSRWCNNCRPPHRGGRYKTAIKPESSNLTYLPRLGYTKGEFKHSKAAKKAISVASKVAWAKRKQVSIMPAEEDGSRS